MLNSFLHKKISGVAIHVLLLLGILCLAGYWPISSNLFSLKNDAYIYFLPCRHFISEQIRSGHFPLWNPYFYMGFPLHGDMQGGVWNPVVWLFSLFTTYTMTTLQYETLLYIFIAGLGGLEYGTIETIAHDFHVDNRENQRIQRHEEQRAQQRQQGHDPFRHRLLLLVHGPARPRLSFILTTQAVIVKESALHSGARAMGPTTRRQ